MNPLDISEPILVEKPEPITVLRSALDALESDSSKSIHLSVRQAETVLDHIRWLVKNLDRTEETVIDLADRLSAFEAVAFEEREP